MPSLAKIRPFPPYVGIDAARGRVGEALISEIQLTVLAGNVEKGGNALKPYKLYKLYNVKFLWSGKL